MANILTCEADIDLSRIAQFDNLVYIHFNRFIASETSGTIDWGDGTTTSVTLRYSGDDWRNHTYSTVGTYTIKMYNLDGISFSHWSTSSSGSYRRLTQQKDIFTAIRLYDGLEHIGGSFICGMKQLTEIAIPASVTGVTMAPYTSSPYYYSFRGAHLKRLIFKYGCHFSTTLGSNYNNSRDFEACTIDKIVYEGDNTFTYDWVHYPYPTVAGKGVLWNHPAPDVTINFPNDNYSGNPGYVPRILVVDQMPSRVNDKITYVITPNHTVLKKSTYSDTLYFKENSDFAYVTIDGVEYIRAYVGLDDTVTIPTGAKLYEIGGANNYVFEDGTTQIGPPAYSTGTYSTTACILDALSIGIPATATSISKYVLKDSAGDIECPDHDRSIYYTGTPTQWQTLLNNVGTPNVKFLAAQVAYTQTVPYETNGGTLQSGFMNPLQAASFPDPMPTCSLGSYVFGGWYYDNASFQNSVVAGSNIPASLTIYAKLYNTITYNLDGGTNNALNKNEYTSVDKAANKPIYSPMKSGYEFAGWFTDSAFTNEVTTCGDFTGAAVTLYAKFTPKYRHEPFEKTANGLEPMHLDAHTVNGYEPFVNINISDMTTMAQLYAKVTDLNARNEHAYFDLSSFISGAYVGLVAMSESGATYKCELVDLLHNTRYTNEAGFTMDQTIAAYIASCVKKDNYVNVAIPAGMTMGQLREYINQINTAGDHAFFDFSNEVDGAYVCTVQMYTQSATNYCFIFDILNGKLYGSYLGYSDSTTVAAYTTAAHSDVVHAISITDTTTTLQDVITMMNRVNQVGHHVFLDVSALSNTDYLITFTTKASGSSTICHALGIVNGTICTGTYTSTQLSSTLLSTFLANAKPIITDIPAEFATKNYVNGLIVTTLNTGV